jgi:hypothetical protein
MPAQRYFTRDVMPADLAAMLPPERRRQLAVLPPVPAHILDAAGYREGGNEVRRDYRESLATGQGERSEMGRDPSTNVGPRRILKLDGPASAYQIVSSANGETWLCFSGKIDGAEEPGRANTGNRFINDARERVQREQAANRRYAAAISDFWKKQSGHA